MDFYQPARELAFPTLAAYSASICSASCSVKRIGKATAPFTNPNPTTTASPTTTPASFTAFLRSQGERSHRPHQSRPERQFYRRGRALGICAGRGAH